MKGAVWKCLLLLTLGVRSYSVYMHVYAIHVHVHVPGLHLETLCRGGKVEIGNWGGGGKGAT